MIAADDECWVVSFLSSPLNQSRASSSLCLFSFPPKHHPTSIQKRKQKQKQKQGKQNPGEKNKLLSLSATFLISASLSHFGTNPIKEKVYTAWTMNKERVREESKSKIQKVNKESCVPIISLPFPCVFYRPFTPSSDRILQCCKHMENKYRYSSRVRVCAVHLPRESK